MKAFFIEAIDTLFFRDGRPFEVGGEANLQIPPSSSTFYGALRSALIAAEPSVFKFFKEGRNTSLKEWVGEYGDSEGSTASIRIKGPVFAKKSGTDITCYFPLPRDLLVYVTKNGRNGEEKYFLIPLRLKQVPPNITTNMDLTYILINPYSENIEYQNLFLNENLFFKYLNGELVQPYEFILGEEVLSTEQIFISDYREGIGLKVKQKNVEKGKLFTQQHMVLTTDQEKQMGFVIKCEVPEAFQSGAILKLGGDGKIAHFRPANIKEASRERIIQQIEKNKKFKVYLSTPALFKMGTKSRAIYNGYFDDIPDLKFELIAAAIGRAEMYGGYDIVANVPKISFPAVPAGSVFYFQLKKGDAEMVFNAFHDKCISDFRNNQGFGYSFVGGITDV